MAETDKAVDKELANKVAKDVEEYFTKVGSVPSPYRALFYCKSIKNMI